MTEKHRGGKAPWPRDMIILAATKYVKLWLTAARIAPHIYKAREVISMTRRPYISESFPKVRVTNADARAGREIAQEYKCIPSRSAAIFGNVTPDPRKK
jgi:hypothetical protein